MRIYPMLACSLLILGCSTAQVQKTSFADAVRRSLEASGSNSVDVVKEDGSHSLRPPETTVVVILQNDGSLMVGGRPTSLAELETIGSVLGHPEKPPLVKVRVPSDARHEDFRAVMDALAKVGIWRVTFAVIRGTSQQSPPGDSKTRADGAASGTPLEITVSQQGEINFQGETVTPRQLSDALTLIHLHRAKGTTPVPVRIRLHPASTHGDLVTVLDTCRMCGFWQFSVAGHGAVELMPIEPIEMAKSEGHYLLPDAIQRCGILDSDGLRWEAVRPRTDAQTDTDDLPPPYAILVCSTSAPNERLLIALAECRADGLTNVLVATNWKNWECRTRESTVPK